MAFLSAPICNTQNILTDGDFSTTTVITPFYGTALPNIWYSFQTAVEASTTVVDGVCNYHIISSGYFIWVIQLMQFVFPLMQGHSYRLSFDVRADANRTFVVFLGEVEGNWTILLAYER